MQINEWCKTTQRLLDNFGWEGVRELGGPEGGVCGVYYNEDEDGDKYAVVGLNLPQGVYAEIDDGTYGELEGIRFYL